MTEAIYNMVAIEESPLSTSRKIEALINYDNIAKINEYCKWANIEDLGGFIEKSAQLIFEKDKDWKAHQRAVKIISRPKKKLAHNPIKRIVH